jgi:hypothetical protein
VVQQRREPGLTRPFGRLVHPLQIARQAIPALPPLCRAPRLSGPSLRSTRCLRRHRRYYTPIRHPAPYEIGAPVIPRSLSPAVTSLQSTAGLPRFRRRLCVHDVVSDPGGSRGTCLDAPRDVAFGTLSNLGTRDSPISWPNTHPARLLSTLRPARYRFRTQDSLRGVWLARMLHERVVDGRCGRRGCCFRAEARGAGRCWGLECTERFVSGSIFGASRH